MVFIVKKFNIIMLLLLVTTLSFGQVKGTKNFTITPQTVIKTNLPKQASCLFEIQRILRERFGQSAIMGGFRAKGNSVIELWTDFDIKGKEHYILDISANKLSIRGATQKALLHGLKTLDRILQYDINNTKNKQIVPVHIDDASATVIQP